MRVMSVRMAVSDETPRGHGQALQHSSRQPGSGAHLPPHPPPGRRRWPAAVAAAIRGIALPLISWRSLPHGALPGRPRVPQRKQTWLGATGDRALGYRAATCRLRGGCWVQ